MTDRYVNFSEVTFESGGRWYGGLEQGFGGSRWRLVGQVWKFSVADFPEGRYTVDIGRGAAGTSVDFSEAGFRSQNFKIR